MYVQVCLHTFGNSLFSFFTPWGPLGLITVRHFSKTCGNTAMPRSGKKTDVGALLFFQTLEMIKQNQEEINATKAHTKKTHKVTMFCLDMSITIQFKKLCLLHCNMLYSIIFMSFYGVLSLSHVTLTVYFVIMFYMIICSVLFVHGTVPFPSTFE